MSHRASTDYPVRRGHEPGDQLRRVASAQLELMAQDVRRLTLALHDLSGRERARRGAPAQRRGPHPHADSAAA
ncbi:hypothetical protein AB0K51_13270 [Kitasatospora sp. NPDC049285]|uniref:hypothetical protein n=1 Tax=Kitasatospora sp. NPDC049285 TaxID=3157096 RepID=UPI00341A2E0E